MNARVLLGSLTLVAAAALFSQGSLAQGQPGGRELRPCSQEPDPAKCEARRKELREHMGQAREACKGKQGRDRAQCMAQQMCAKAPDPAKCQAQAKERMERRREMREKSGEKGVSPKT